MTSNWWRRNLPWLVVLLPLLALAFAASSQRFVNYFMPWEHTAPQYADEQGVVEFHQEFKGIEIQHERDVTIRLLDVGQADVVGAQKAAAGGQMWKVRVEMSAEPDVVLSPCEVALVADGKEYGFGAAVEPAEADGFAMPSLFPNCESPDSEGPSFGVFDDTVTMPAVPRPEKWEVEFGIVVPQGVEPEEFRMWWVTPEYASFPIQKDR